MKKLLSFIKEMFNRKDKEEVYIDDIFDPQLKWTKSLVRENTYLTEGGQVRYGVGRIDPDVVTVSVNVRPNPWRPTYIHRGDEVYPDVVALIARLECTVE